jgi:hypothetical protein
MQETVTDLSVSRFIRVAVLWGKASNTRSPDAEVISRSVPAMSI